MKKTESKAPVGGLMPAPQEDKRALERRPLPEPDDLDEFEEEFRADSDAPLTDAVRAARKELGAGRLAEEREFSDAFEEDDEE